MVRNNQICSIMQDHGIVVTSVVRFIFFILCITLNANAVLKISVNKGVIVPDPIAVASFTNSDGSTSQTGTEISKIITNDLQISGRFAPLNEQSFVEKASKLALNGPNAANWRVVGARFLIYGTIVENGNNLTITFTVFDVMNNIKLITATTEGNYASIRKAAHTISDIAFKRILNENSYFSKRIVCVKTVKSGAKRTTCLVVTDHDGENQSTITEQNNLVLMPTSSPDNASIAFVLNMQSVCILNLKTGVRRTIIGVRQQKLLEKAKKMQLQGITAPRFADNDTLVMTCTMDGKSAIFFYKIGKEFVQDTTFSCIQTVPFVKGSTMLFTSDTTGVEKIYTKICGANNITRVGTGSGKQSCPIFVENKIVFVKAEGGKFHLCVMNKDGSGERVIFSAYFLDSVCHCAGGYVAFDIKQNANSNSQIAIIHINGYGYRTVKINGDISQPTFIGNEM